jgi:hypothetical protein
MEAEISHLGHLPPTSVTHLPAEELAVYGQNVQLNDNWILIQKEKQPILEVRSGWL